MHPTVCCLPQVIACPLYHYALRCRYMIDQSKIVATVAVLVLVLVVTVFSMKYTQGGVMAEDKYPHLTEAQEKVLFEKGTEPAFTSELLDEHRAGTYVTADTGLPVFRSEAKYESGSGWPSFYEPISENVELKEDNSFFMKRVEVVSKDTGAHLGHVFDDGPEPTGKRFCMNGVALKFIPDEEEN